MSSLTPVLPVLTDDFFLPDAIDFNMANNPCQPMYTFADDANGIQTISQLEFGRAAHRVAHLLRPNRYGADGEVVAIIALADTVMYQAIVAGLIVAGCVPFPISPRNSPNAVVELLTKTSSRRLLTTRTFLTSLVNTIEATLPNLKIEEIPSLSSVYPYLALETTDHPFKPYPRASRHPFKDDLCLYLHSSGSTGNPRPIPITQIYWTRCAYPTDLKEYKPRLTIGVMFMPGFHCFGIAMQLFQPIFGVLSVSVYPPSAPTRPPIVPSPENVLEHMSRTNSNALIAPPSFLQVWATRPDALDYLKTLKFIGFGGGPLPLNIGNMIVDAGVRIYAMYGATEFGMSTRFIPVVSGYDWEYMQFHEHQRVRWEAQGDGTFELQFLSWEKHQTMINNLPDAEGYATSDLWSPHPSDPSLWKIVGRIDDVITHSSGEKTVPGPMESIINSNPLIQDAIIFGRERNQTGVLIELHAESNDEDRSIRDELWHTIDEANNIAPAHSRIFKEMILITSIDKPLPRTAKGTVQRKAAIQLYEEEINALYEFTNGVPEKSSLPASWSVSDIEAWLVDQARNILSGTFDVTVDLFEQGFDSLCALSLEKRVVKALRTSDDLKFREAVTKISSNLIYSFPVIKDLAVFLSSIPDLPEAPHGSEASSTAAAMEAMIEKYTVGFDVSLPGVSSQSDAISHAVVLLTGSTGNLGSHILAELLGDPRVDKVYTYNRPSKSNTKTIMERHHERFDEIGLDVALLNSEKLVHTVGQSAQSDLGLDPGDYSDLCNTVTVVIHTAWRIDFNLSLASYEPNIQGTRHLIDLVKAGPNSANTCFLFVSSIAAVQNWDKSKGPVPENVMDDPHVALGGGYGEAKHVSERILQLSGLRGVSLRIGQISGGYLNGVWPITEWLPILVKSSVALGSIPEAPGLASWLRADTVSASIVDIALDSPSTPLPAALHLVHPRPVYHRDVIVNIRKAIREILGHDLKLVPFCEWLAIVESHADDLAPEILASIPAVKLLKFFRNYAEANISDVAEPCKFEAGGLPSLSTEMVQRVSLSMRHDRLQQMGYEDAKLWVSYWHGVGFF